MTALASLTQAIKEWGDADPANAARFRAMRDQQWSDQAEFTPTGLVGYESAVKDGTRGAINATGRAMGYQQPYMQGGAGAQNLQAALSGALGPQAQQQAYNNYNSSPGMDYALQQSERALTRNAAATGGLGGGNIQRALQENAIGIAQQDYQNQFNNLGSLSNRGINSANTMGGYQGQNAQYLNNQGVNLGNARLNTGVNIANTLGGISDGMAQYNAQGGADVSGITATGSNNLAGMLAGAGNQANLNNQALATMGSNIATGSASQVAALPMPNYAVPDYLGGAGAMISATGQLLQGYGNTNNTFNSDVNSGMNYYNQIPQGNYNPSAL